MEITRVGQGLDQEWLKENESGIVIDCGTKIAQTQTLQNFY